MKKLILQLSQVLAVCMLLASQTVTAQTDDSSWSQAELDQMLAPVALYPDTVLTHVLIAATYPLEVVQAARWLDDNPNITGEDAVRAVENKGWDPSVTALVAFPQLLKRLSSDLDWTQQLGEAFLTDETQVLASIQNLRQKAYANGSLNDNKHVFVEREREVIVIEPARKEIVYVPVYDTRVVYGDWWWPSHPPVYWHTAGVYYRSSPFHWGVSVNVRPWFYFGIFDWHQRHVVVHHHYYHTPPRYYPKRHKHYVDARRWHHNAEHRRGVHYRHERLNRDYNTGYGYHQPTRELQGKPVRHARADSNVTVREHKPLYQRKTADQVRLRQHDWQTTEQNPRQRNQDLRQQRQTKTEQQLNNTAADRVDQHRKVQQQLAEQQRPAQVINTAQLRQRDAVRQQSQRQAPVEARQQTAVVQQQLTARQPRQANSSELRQPPREVKQPQREMRQPQREVVVKQKESRSRSIE
ncbi:DUF3300 domain-containing protein [Rheinheimera maricola]|uniref:DUF3300 domain-containing protein n=1 Tax=Rheinheimera maricola TaxID=2793282 RepID=A0ABS7XD24_9GAMM|nr:DUF3300 domain-containing protein [Rheinheimera maricola]MBZ9612512.1 DUF3300 domain-containing protein [Rheinheimera maricola]